jgi:tetratricopeptide (TPR) repeat protein
MPVPDALALAEEAVRRNPQDAYALRALASQQIARNRIDDAEATAAELIRVAPGWGESLNTRGRVFLRRKKFHQAEAEFRAALQVAPDEPAYMNNLGIALERQGRRKEAIEAFKNAALKDPTFATARKNLLTTTQRYLWGGLAVFVLAVLLHAAAAGAGGAANRAGVLLLLGVVAVVVALYVVRYWLRRRSLDPGVGTYYEVETRFARRHPSVQTMVRAGVFVLLLGAVVATALIKQPVLEVLFLLLALLWLHRGAAVWRYVSGRLSRSQV